MRLWDYRLLKVLPDKFIIAQWRECIAIKRQWEKGTLIHPLIGYVKNYDKQYFCKYVDDVVAEMNKRHINYNSKYYDEIFAFCNGNSTAYNYYPEHDIRYLKQCYYNLQEKYDRGIISEEEWKKIESTVDTMEQAIVSSKNGIGFKLQDTNKIEIYGGV